MPLFKEPELSDLGNYYFTFLILHVKDPAERLTAITLALEKMHKTLQDETMNPFRKLLKFVNSPNF